MERRRLKNIIILILLILNGFLLSYLIQRQTSKLLISSQIKKNLTVLFAENGVTLDSNAISLQTPSDVILLPRDANMEALVATLFLGSDIKSTVQGTTKIYHSSTASASFYSDASFSITGLSISEQPEVLCRKFCHICSYQEPDFSGALNGTLLTLAQYGNGKFSVFNYPIVFTFENGILREVSGVLLTQNGISFLSDVSPLSASSALTAFLSMLQQNRAVASTVDDMYLCYSLQKNTMDMPTLFPTWCIVTDTIYYYVDCITGVVSAA